MFLESMCDTDVLQMWMSVALDWDLVALHRQLFHVITRTVATAANV